MGAFYFQFGLNEDPCPLCLLQRMAMIGVIFGLALNIFFGFDAKHFGVVIISALVGVLFSGRQVLLHISKKDGDVGYGTPFFGMHLYTWGVLIFIASILGSAIFLFFGDKTNITLSSFVYFSCSASKASSSGFDLLKKTW